MIGPGSGEGPRRPRFSADAFDADVAGAQAEEERRIALAEDFASTFAKLRRMRREHAERVANEVPPDYARAAEIVGKDHMHAYLAARDAYFSPEGFHNHDLKARYETEYNYVRDHLRDRPDGVHQVTKFEGLEEVYKSERVHLRHDAEEQQMHKAIGASEFGNHLFNEFAVARRAYLSHIDKGTWSDRGTNFSEAKLREAYIRARNDLLRVAAVSSEVGAGRMDEEESFAYRERIAKLFVDGEQERINGRSASLDPLAALMRDETIATAYGRYLKRSFQAKSAAALENLLDPEFPALREQLGNPAFIRLIEARRAYYAARIAAAAHDYDASADRGKRFGTYEQMRDALLKKGKAGVNELKEADKALELFAKQGAGKPNGTRRLKYAGSPLPPPPPRPTVDPLAEWPAPAPFTEGFTEASPEEWEAALALPDEFDEEGYPINPDAWPEQWFKPVPQEAAEDEVVLEESAPEDVAPRLDEEKVLPLPEDPVPYVAVEYQKGSFYANFDGRFRRLLNANEKFVLPGDEVVISVENGEAEIVDVAFQGRATVLGRLEQSQQGELMFVVRAPNETGRFDKFRFSADPITSLISERQVQYLLHERAYIIFDRNQMKIVGDPIPQKKLTSYQAADLSVRTNLGVEQHDEETVRLKKSEREQLAALKAAYGIRATTDNDKQLRDSAVRRMESSINADVRRKHLRDRRDHVTIAVDEKVTRVRDDAFSIGPSKFGEGWQEVNIHVADPRLLIPAGSSMDRAAAERATGIFLPDDRIPMLPREVAMLATLDEGYDRRALSLVFHAKLGEGEGIEIRGIEFADTAIRVKSQMEYDDATKLLNEDPSDEVAEAWDTFAEVMHRLNKRNVVRKPVNGNPPRTFTDSHDIIAFANETFNRAAAEGFERYKRSPHPRLKQLEDMVLGAYTTTRTVRGKTESVLSTEAGDHERFGADYAYVSSPLRKYSSIVGMRALGFLAEVQRTTSKKRDITEPVFRKLVEKYARDVVGLPLSDELLALDTEAFVEAIARESKEFVDDTLKHSHRREEITERTERAMEMMKALDRIGKDTLRGPVQAPDEGFVVEFTDKRSEPSIEGDQQWVYGEMQLSRKKNGWLFKKYAKRTERFTVGVKFPLRKGMKFPKAPATRIYSGSIIDVQMESGRLVLDVSGAVRSPSNGK